LPVRSETIENLVGAINVPAAERVGADKHCAGMSIAAPVDKMEAPFLFLGVERLERSGEPVFPAYAPATVEGGQQLALEGQGFRSRRGQEMALSAGEGGQSGRGSCDSKVQNGSARRPWLYFLRIGERSGIQFASESVAPSLQFVVVGENAAATSTRDATDWQTSRFLPTLGRFDVAAEKGRDRLP
jgi:hypothetical protein